MTIIGTQWAPQNPLFSHSSEPFHPPIGRRNWCISCQKCIKRVFCLRINIIVCNICNVVDPMSSAYHRHTIHWHLFWCVPVTSPRRVHIVFDISPWASGLRFFRFEGIGTGENWIPTKKNLDGFVFKVTKHSSSMSQNLRIALCWWIKTLKQQKNHC